MQSRLAKRRKVTILPHTTDRYGRTVAEVISDLNINLVLVEDGQAFAYRQYLGGCDAQKYQGCRVPRQLAPLRGLAGSGRDPLGLGSSAGGDATL
ncbi:MAG: thermonuclease family protein [Cyanobacteria bacterium]|nr:thermonuclease family protein [Cyanobacteriota bacterium]